MAKVSIKETGETVGVWVEGDRGCIALVYQEGVGPYLILYGKNYKTVPLAIGVDPDGKEAFLQIAGPDGTIQSVRHVGLSQILGTFSARHDCPECGHSHEKD